MANLLSVCIAMMAMENCALGASPGSASRTETTWGRKRRATKLRGEAAHLRLRRDVAGEKEPQEALREGLAALDRGGELILELRDGVAAEPDALLSVQ